MNDRVAGSLRSCQLYQMGCLYQLFGCDCDIYGSFSYA